MAILAFQKPDKVLMLEADSKFGKFEFRPLEPVSVLPLVMLYAVFFFLRWKVMRLTLFISKVLNMNLQLFRELRKMLLTLS